MEKHVRFLLNRLSFAAITIATLILLLLYLQTPDTCFDPSNPNPKPHTRFPKSTCDFTHRAYTSHEKRNRRIWSTKAWTTAVSSYTSLFKALQALANQSHVLVVSAGPGQAVQSLKELGVEDVTGVELVESLPLVSGADPHNLPFFDGSFDLGFGVYLDRALFPRRYVGQIERTVRSGGVCVVTVEKCGMDEVGEIVKLFTKSRYVESKNVILAGERRTMVVMKVESKS